MVSLVSLSTGCHKKAPVCCPCNHSATVHDAPQTLLLVFVGVAAVVIDFVSGVDVVDIFGVLIAFVVFVVVIIFYIVFYFILFY